MSRPRSERPRATTVLSHLAVMVAVSAILGVVVSGLAIPFAGVLGFAAKETADSMDELPVEFETDALPQRTRIVDAADNTIATVFDENRVNVSLDNISRTMVKAIVSIEDYRFYQHGALDLRGTVRALVTNQAADGVVQGGSSITQQLVKLTLLNQADTDEEEAAATADTYARKLKELRYAIALEQQRSKDWILERYLNTAYFGDGAYGVQAAAQHYFDVSARRLDLNQSAILAGLVQNPTAFDPTNYPERTVVRRDVVLDRMAQLNVVPQKRADRVKARGLAIDPQPTQNGCVSSRAPFFCDYVLRYLVKDPSLGPNVEERRKLINSGGLTIKTTIDLRYQDAADASVANRVYPRDEAVGSLAMVEPGTGEVKAIAQSRPMGGNTEEGETFLNYSVPTEYGDAAGFQPGSTFKAFVLAAAINEGLPLSTSIRSPQQVFLPSNTFETCDGFYQSSEVWDPSNSTGEGTYDFYSGTQNSVNTFFAQLEQRIGLCEPYNLAKAMGVRLSNPATEMVPSFTLGVADVSPLEMAEAYATFAARGLHCDSRPVSSIEDADGTVLKEYPAQCTQVMPSSTADAVNDVLRGVQENGGFGDIAGIDLPLLDDAGKTGTTQSNYSVWFNGYTPSLATASVIAGAQPDGIPRSLTGVSLGPTISYSPSGSTTAGPMWGDAMREIAQYLPPEEFTAPNTLDVGGVLTSIPDVAGLSVDEAVDAIRGAGFRAQLGGFRDSEYARDDVAFTAPVGGDQLNAGDTVTIFQSNGEDGNRRGRGRG